MGISHPILGLLTITIVLTILVGAITFMLIYYTNLHDALLSIPMTIGHVSCQTTIKNETYIKIYVADVHKPTLILKHLWIETKNGIIQIPINENGIGETDSILVYTYGFHERNKLLEGQPGAVWVNAPKHVFEKGNIYTLTLYFKVLGKDAFTTQNTAFKSGEIPSCDEIVKCKVVPPDRVICHPVFPIHPGAED